MAENAHDPGFFDPGSGPPRSASTGRSRELGREPGSTSAPAGMTLAALVEREVSEQESAGRTMASWFDRIELIPDLEPGWAAEAIRELRQADNPRNLE